MNDETKKKLKCGLVMPISAIDGCTADHWEEVKRIIKEALIDTQFDVELVSDSNEIGIIHKRIVQNIFDNDIIVCDVSAKNPNVMLELGMRLAFDKPAIIIIDDKTNYSFDTSPIEHLQYPRDLHYHAIQTFKLKLRDKIVATHAASLKSDYTTFLKHFGQFVIAKIDETPVGKDEFLLTAVSELRNEVQILAKSVRTRGDDLFPLPDDVADSAYRRRLAKMLRRSSMLDTELIDKSELEFITDYLVNRGSFVNDDVFNPKSQAFESLFKEYLAKRGLSQNSEKELPNSLIREHFFHTLNKIGMK